MPRSKPTDGKSSLVKIATKKHQGITKPSTASVVAPTVLAQVAATMVRPSRNAAKVVLPRYFRNPVYGPSTAVAGGTSMNVQIGPAQGGAGNYGSTPEVDTPTNMRWLKDNEPAFGWVAGHLLNDNLGGPGLAKNLTPLSTAGNKNHLTGCEAIIKLSIDRAFSHAEFNKSDAYWYGVEYSVTVGAIGWPNLPANVFAPVELRVSAKVIRYHKATGAIDDARLPGCPSLIYFTPIVNLAIDNSGWV